MLALSGHTKHATLLYATFLECEESLYKSGVVCGKRCVERVMAGTAHCASHFHSVKSSNWPHVEQNILS